MINIVVAGVSGRMGSLIVRSVCNSSDMRLTSAIGHSGKHYIGYDVSQIIGDAHKGVSITDDAELALKGAHCLIDFTSGAFSAYLAKITAELCVAHVIGSTGMTPAEESVIIDASNQTKIVKSPNMSIGANLAMILAQKAAEVLDDSFDVDILDIHHRHKKDSPSGTAIALADAVARGRRAESANRSVSQYNCVTTAGTRENGSIDISSMRCGTFIGEHEVIFAGVGESIKISHIAQDRGLFAKGAIRAALWVVNKPNGLYSMLDVLGSI